MQVPFPFPVSREPEAWLTAEIPVFAGRSPETRAADPYDRDFAVVDLYTGLAYGHLLFGEGSAEPLYRTLASFVLGQREARTVLDVGCGAGRLLFDCAAAMPQTQFCGVDLSYNMCLRTGQMVRGTDPFRLPCWADRGRGDVVVREARCLPNVAVAQASAEDLPFPAMSFDVVAAALVLCRLSDPFRGLAEMVRMLTPGGRLFLITPLGFRDSRLWDQIASPDRMRSLLASLGLQAEEWFEGLRYREVIDSNHNVHEWNCRVIAARLLL